MLLTSRQNPLCKLVRSLHTTKGRRAEKLFLAEGRNAVCAAIESDWPISRVLTTSESLEYWRAKLQNTVELQPATPEILEYLGDAETTPEVLALCHLPAQSGSLVSESLLLIIDGVGDPGNVGTLIRAADAAGAGGVLLTANSADPFSPKSVRASAGSLFHLPPTLLQRNSPAEISELLTEAGTPIIIAEAEGETSCFEYSWPTRCALVLGHETRGVSPEFQAAASERISIPIHGKAESLNVAMAGTVLLYAWRNSLTQK